MYLHVRTFNSYTATRYTTDSFFADLRHITAAGWWGGIFMYITKTMKISFSLSLFSIAKNEILKRTHTLTHTTYMSVHLTPTLPLDTLQIPSSPISDTLQLQGGGGGGEYSCISQRQRYLFLCPSFPLQRMKSSKERTHSHTQLTCTCQCI